MKTEPIPIRTTIGILKGRDALYLDEIRFNYPGELILYGTINTDILDKPEGWLGYALFFYGVQAVTIVDLDSSGKQSTSCFDWIKDSAWITQLNGKITNQHRHYRVQTYDDVFDIVCLSYELRLIR